VAHAAGVLLGMRLGVSALWPAAYDPFDFPANGRRFRHAFTAPPDFRRDRALLESDGDPWTINLVGHSLFGSEVWQRARACGAGPVGAFALTTATSVAWEYGLEAFHKQPSAIDLVLTSTTGALLGEARARVSTWARRAGASLPRRALGVLVDPFGSLERGIGTSC